MRIGRPVLGPCRGISSISRSSGVTERLQRRIMLMLSWRAVGIESQVVGLILSLGVFKSDQHSFGQCGRRQCLV